MGPLGDLNLLDSELKHIQKPGVIKEQGLTELTLDMQQFNDSHLSTYSHFVNFSLCQFNLVNVAKVGVDKGKLTKQEYCSIPTKDCHNVMYIHMYEIVAI